MVNLKTLNQNVSRVYFWRSRKKFKVGRIDKRGGGAERDRGRNIYIMKNKGNRYFI